jgi:hypothetical protein
MSTTVTFLRNITAVKGCDAWIVELKPRVRLVTDERIVVSWLCVAWMDDNTFEFILALLFQGFLDLLRFIFRYHHVLEQIEAVRKGQHIMNLDSLVSFVREDDTLEMDDEGIR